jgi:Superinfection immunity protein/Short C-terminal domain
MWYHHYHSWWPVSIVGWFIAFVLLFPYFLPTIIAILRRKANAGGIFVLNLLLGWTLIGWIGALVWSLSADAQPTIIVHNQSAAAPPPPPPPQSHAYTNVTVRKPVASAGSNQQDKIDQLRQLKQLLDEGVLTEEEFNRQKAAILG